MNKIAKNTILGSKNQENYEEFINVGVKEKAETYSDSKLANICTSAQSALSSNMVTNRYDTAHLFAHLIRIWLDLNIHR